MVVCRYGVEVCRFVASAQECASEYVVWCRPNIHSTCWKIVEGLIDVMLSTPHAFCIPYLQDNRIDVPSIKVHPWVLKPLIPMYDTAMEGLLGEQKVIDERLKQGVYSNPDRDKILEVRKGKV